jgi:diguanylate cyclase (GGDEF)-like protein
MVSQPLPAVDPARWKTWPLEEVSVATGCADAFPDGLLERTEALVLVVGEDETVVRANPAAATACRSTLLEMAGRDAGALVVPRDEPQFRQALRLALRRGTPSAREYELASTGPERRAVAWSITRLSREPALVACIGVDVSATRAEVEFLRNRALTDQLTGLPNRAGLLEHFASVGAGAMILFCDLDGFKAVNDELGHAAGDAVLVHVARRLTRTVRGEDFVARLGGDEFVIVVPPHPPSDYEALGRRLLAAFTQPIVLPGPAVATVTMSIGQGLFSPGDDPEEILAIADRDMYRMKSGQGAMPRQRTTANNANLQLAEK